METVKRNEIENYILDNIDYFEGTELEELHHNLFNTDYYIIGRYEAEQWLNDIGVFTAIREIQDYESFNFGETYTDITEAENVVNMYVYILGEEILYSLDIDFDGELTAEIIENIKYQLTKTD